MWCPGRGNRAGCGCWTGCCRERRRCWSPPPRPCSSARCPRRSSPERLLRSIRTARPSTRWSRSCSAAATAAAIWWRAAGSTPGAETSWTSSPPVRSGRCGWNTGATRWTPWASSTPTPSGARRPWRNSGSCRRRRPCRACLHGSRRPLPGSCGSSPPMSPGARRWASSRAALCGRTPSASSRVSPSPGLTATSPSFSRITPRRWTICPPTRSS